MGGQRYHVMVRETVKKVVKIGQFIRAGGITDQLRGALGGIAAPVHAPPEELNEVHSGTPQLPHLESLLTVCHF